MTRADAFDVAVVGAGPAGATCARLLARAGLRVVVLERERPPRYKTCGGGVVARAARWMEIDLDGVVERECATVELNFLDAGLSFRLAGQEPLVLMTMRAELDRRLLDAARAEGAELAAPFTVTGVVRAAPGVELAGAANERVRARYAVAADGALSPTARAAGWSAPRRVVPALETELSVGAADFARFAERARFDFEAVPHGYAWVFPKRAHLSVGCLSAQRGARGLKAALERYLARLGLANWERREDHGFVIPVAPRAARARARVLLVGDAAGLADPVTCEGISFAVQSARLAAEAIAEHFAAPRAVERAYERALAREILPELWRARRLAALLYGRPRLARALFQRAGEPLCEAMRRVIAGEATYRELLGRKANLVRLARRILA